MHGGIPQQNLCFIAGAQHQTFEDLGLVKKDDHALARHHIPPAAVSHIRIAVEQWLDHIGDWNRECLDSERVNHQLSVSQ